MLEGRSPVMLRRRIGLEGYGGSRPTVVPVAVMSCIVIVDIPSDGYMCLLSWKNRS